jgi:cation diffusion facilitator family transporter
VAGGESKVAVVAALLGNLLIAILKLVAGLISGSASMLAEAAHSFSDVGNQILLLIGISRAHAPPSAKHPYGTGKAAYFWPFMVAILLFGIAGAYSVFEGYEKIAHPHELGDIV